MLFNISVRKAKELQHGENKLTVFFVSTTQELNLFGQTGKKSEKTLADLNHLFKHHITQHTGFDLIYHI